MDENLPQQNIPATGGPPPPAPAAPPTAQAAPATPSPQIYGGFVYRWAALIIDGLIVSVVAAPLALLLGRGGATLWALGYGIYAIVMDVYYGTTLGKKIFKMYVTDEAGNRLQLGQAVLREILGKVLSGLVLNLGYLWVAFDAKKQGWHDKIAKTYVVQKEQPTSGLKALAWAIVIIQLLIIAAGIILTAGVMSWGGDVTKPYF